MTINKLSRVGVNVSVLNAIRQSQCQQRLSTRELDVAIDEGIPQWNWVLHVFATELASLWV